MNEAGPRETLARLVRERRDDYANLSRLIGRNPAYIQQFIKRGTPRKLDEADRATLSRYFGVDERALGGPALAAARALFDVPQLEVGASAGPGALAGDEAAVGRFGFDERWLRRIATGRPEDLSIIRVSGDSMVPALADGDDILVDRSDAADRLRDGIYVLRREELLLVKRITVEPSGRLITIGSDNSDHPTFTGVKRGDVAIIGRVVWAGRRVL